jgi:hypothetical protein
MDRFRMPADVVRSDPADIGDRSGQIDPAVSRPMSLRHSTKGAVQVVLLAAAITVTQIFFTALYGNGGTWPERSMSYFTWDAGWYANIVENGYRPTSPAGAGAQYNLAFFPGYPAAATILRRIFNLSIPSALFLTSWLAAFTFWAVLVRTLKRWNAPPGVALLVLVAVFCQPGAFYLVVPYSESLFMAALLIFTSLGVDSGSSGWRLAIASAAGFIMSATRVIAAPLAVLPAIWLLAALSREGISPLRCLHRAPHLVWRYLAVSISTAAGTITFLVYCAMRFGHWDEYARARVAGWGASNTSFTAAFSPQNFHLTVPRFGEDLIVAPDISHIYVAVTMTCLILIPAIDCYFWWRRRGTDIFERATLYLGAWILFFLSAAGSGISQGLYVGFFRYGFYSIVLLAVAAGHAYTHSPKGSREIPLPAQIALFLLFAVELALQLQIAYRYTHGVLVA